MRKKLTKKCTKCGEERPIDEFYTRKADGSKYPRCRHCMRQEKRESYARIHKVPDKLYRNETTGRLMEHSGYSTRIHWSTPMDEKMRRMYATTKNEDLAIDLGVSVRTLVRRARTLGLKKNNEWIAAQNEWLKNHTHTKQSILTNANAYENMFFALFCDNNEQLQALKSGGLFPELELNCKEYLENYFNIDLTL